MAARSDDARIEPVSTSRAASLRHVRPVQPLHFPEQEPDEERDKYPIGLRLARDVEGHDLVLTVDERRIAEVRVRDERILELEERLASAARANPLS